MYLMLINVNKKKKKKNILRMFKHYKQILKKKKDFSLFS